MPAWGPERIRRDFDASSIFNKDLSRYTGLFEGQPVPALARELPGWESEAVAAMATHLTASGFQILDDRPVLRRDDPKHDPILGTLRVRRYGWDAVGVVRVDEVGEISFEYPTRRRSTALCGNPLPMSRTPGESSVVFQLLVTAEESFFAVFFTAFLADAAALRLTPPRPTPWWSGPRSPRRRRGS